MPEGCPAQDHAGVQDKPEVEVEYVSAPHEYEELLQSEVEAEAEPTSTAGLGSPAGGLGFIKAGTPGADQGSGTALLSLHAPAGLL